MIETYFYPAMGLLALGVLWLNTLLIAAAALQRRTELSRELSALLRAKREGLLREGVVQRGEGPEDAVVSRTLHQVGRAMTVQGPVRILFTESRAEHAVHGGELLLAGETVALATNAPLRRVWLRSDAPLRREHSDFEQAYSGANTARGLKTFAVTSVRAGDRVHFQSGELLATMDPIQLVRVKRRGLALFAWVAVLLCAGLTSMVLMPPVFGTLSTIGGALSLLFFVLVQPAGVKARNWAHLPDEQPRTDLWQRS